MRRYLVISLAALLASASTLAIAPSAVMAQSIDQINEAELIARFNPEQQRLYAEWRQARATYSALQDRYWASITALKSERRRKRGAGLTITPADFVQHHPAKYAGPALRADIIKMIDQMQPIQPVKPADAPLPVLADFLANAQQHFGFTPRTASEREFKRHYAIEAVAFGLSKDQVVRVYALETGGRGTFDMQAGFDPETRKGRAISTAMGYAQLLAANSVSELVSHGEGFISRLNMMAAAPDTSRERSAELFAKANAVRAMLKAARSVPRDWADHQRLARTPAGMGIHALNLDGDIGPWLQAVKLRGLKEIAEKASRPGLSGAEIELMNLAGPRTGLEMLEPVAQSASTANFFAPASYWINSIAREKTAAELLVALDVRMNENLVHAGAIEFATVFDEVQAGGTLARPFAYLTATPASAATPPRHQASSSTAPSTPATAASANAPRMQWAPRQFGAAVTTDPSRWAPVTATD